MKNPGYNAEISFSSYNHYYRAILVPHLTRVLPSCVMRGYYKCTWTAWWLPTTSEDIREVFRFYSDVVVGFVQTGVLWIFLGQLSGI